MNAVKFVCPGTPLWVSPLFRFESAKPRITHRSVSPSVTTELLYLNAKRTLSIRRKPSSLQSVTRVGNEFLIGDFQAVRTEPRFGRVCLLIERLIDAFDPECLARL